MDVPSAPRLGDRSPRASSTSALALGLPLFVKPANLGSSVGISKVKAASALDAAVEQALEFDRKVVVEAGVPDAREIECAVLGNDDPEASVAGEIIPSREFYDYEAKYLDDGSQTMIPADLSGAQLAEVQRLAIEAFRRSTPPACRASISCCRATTGALVRQRDQHHPRLHDDQHVREAVGGQRRRLTPRWSIA